MPGRWLAMALPQSMITQISSCIFSRMAARNGPEWVRSTGGVRKMAPVTLAGLSLRGNPGPLQAPLPAEYSQRWEEETAARIGRARATLGSRAVILGHHYQRDEIIRWADYPGDSYKLSVLAARRKEAEF